MNSALKYFSQVYKTGKLVSFSKNAMEVCYKTVVQQHQVGLEDEAQTAVLTT